MRCFFQLVGTVLLLALLGADVGLQSVAVLDGKSSLIVAAKTALTSMETAKTTDMLQAASAVVVALFTIGLFCVGRQQYCILREQHELSRRQSAIAERLQSPLITIEIETPGIGVNTRGGLPYYQPGILTYRLKNHGEVPVSLLGVYEVFQPIKPKGSGLPKPISPSDPNILPMSYGVLVPPHGRSDLMAQNLFHLLLGAEQNSFRNQDVALFMTFFARFQDIFESRWIMGLCYIYDDLGRKWVLAGGTKEHNYHRREV